MEKGNVLSEYSCYHCGSLNGKKAGFADNARRMMFCRDCRRHYIAHTAQPSRLTVRKVKTPDAASIKPKESSKSPKGNSTAVTPRKYTTEEIIASLQELDSTLDRRIRRGDIENFHKKGKGPSVKEVIDTFGGTLNAIKVAGVKMYPLFSPGRVRGYQSKYADRKLISDLKNLGRALKRPPLGRDIKHAAKQGLCASVETYIRKFESLVNARRIAGFPAPRLSAYTEVELIACLKDLIQRLGRFPTYADIEQAADSGLCPPLSVFLKEMGPLGKVHQKHFPDARKKAVSAKYTDEDLLADLRRLIKELGKFPTYKEMLAAHTRGTCAYPLTIFNRFGNSHDICRRYFPEMLHSLSNRIYTNDEIITAIRRLVDETGTFPTRSAIDTACRENKCPSSSTIISRFGGLSKFRRQYFPDEKDPVHKVSHSGYTDKELIAEVKRFANEIGRFPTLEKLWAASREGRCPSPYFLQKRLGKIAEVRRKYFSEYDRKNFL